jgi:hypothetical protein
MNMLVQHGQLGIGDHVQHHVILVQEIELSYVLIITIV